MVRFLVLGACRDFFISMERGEFSLFFNVWFGSFPGGNKNRTNFEQSVFLSRFETQALRVVRERSTHQINFLKNAL